MRVDVLDHGYVQLIESWGSDERVIESARMSTDKGFLGWGTTDKPGDERLLHYLYKNKHFTPFEMAGFTIEVQAPIFVFREWHRHRTQSYNELSARYTSLPDLCYIPTVERLVGAKQATKNKQSSETGFDEHEARVIQHKLQEVYFASREAYDYLLENEVAREIARLVVPVAQYSRMRASTDLRNWLGFLDLRQSSNAQYEIRQYANAVAKIADDLFPRTFNIRRTEQTHDS